MTSYGFAAALVADDRMAFRDVNRTDLRQQMGNATPETLRHGYSAKFATLNSDRLNKRLA